MTGGVSGLGAEVTHLSGCRVLSDSGWPEARSQGASWPTHFMACNARRFPSMQKMLIA